MKKPIVLFLAAFFAVSSALPAQASSGCSSVYREEVVANRSTYFQDLKELYSYHNYRRYTDTMAGAVLSYPIMVVAATIMGVVVMPGMEAYKASHRSYARKMAEFTASTETKTALKMERKLFKSVSRKIEIDRKTFHEIVSDLKTGSFFCPYTDRITLSEEGRRYLERHGVKDVYELYAIVDDERVFREFWETVSHFEFTRAPSPIKKKEVVKNLVNELKRKGY
ncbi:MAG: hypothetical protein A2X94_01505 [Bdellovibrionales bacterium GWB1_55_8]|nr:MAG: hypothetical protein A2X94_01505 [Bdellovibrionales bacterium GWB1_55_8]